MRIAVTGGTGFIGRHVLQELSHHDVQVTAVVRRYSDHELSLPAHNFVELDMDTVVTAPFDLIGRPDVLIHLAWDALPNHEVVTHLEDELPRQHRFLHALLEAGLPALVVSGTCAEYGLKSGPLREDMETSPVTPYAISKDALRRQLQFLQSAYTFALCWIRLFYLYGEGQHETSLFPQLRSAVLRGDTVFNMSGGKQLRDYLPVSTAARYIVQLAMLRKDIGIVNACSGHPISIRELVTGWIKENGWNIEPNLGYYPYRDSEADSFWGVREKLDRLLPSQ